MSFFFLLWIIRNGFRFPEKQEKKREQKKSISVRYCAVYSAVAIFTAIYNLPSIPQMWKHYYSSSWLLQREREGGESSRESIEKGTRTLGSCRSSLSLLCASVFEGLPWFSCWISGRSWTSLNSQSFLYPAAFLSGQGIISVFLGKWRKSLTLGVNVGRRSSHVILGRHVVRSFEFFLPSFCLRPLSVIIISIAVLCLSLDFLVIDGKVSSFVSISMVWCFQVFIFIYWIEIFHTFERWGPHFDLFARNLCVIFSWVAWSLQDHGHIIGNMDLWDTQMCLYWWWDSESVG